MSYGHHETRLQLAATSHLYNFAAAVSEVAVECCATPPEQERPSPQRHRKDETGAGLLWQLCAAGRDAPRTSGYSMSRTSLRRRTRTAQFLYEGWRE